jgi:superfamily II DNA or RNA helicase
MCSVKGVHISTHGYYLKRDTLNDDQIKSIKDELTVKPKTFELGFEDTEDLEYKLYTNTKKYLCVPTFWGIEKYGMVDNKLEEHAIDVNFLGKLRDYQEPITALLVKHLKEKFGGALCVPCGRGKTLMAIYVACVLKQKTLVIVHKSFLLDQWVVALKKFTNSKIGTIRGKTIDVEGCDFVIGMIQSISMKDYEEDLFKQFSFVIYDEAHHCASKVFSNSLKKINTKYKLALSATPYRGDGLIKVMHWFLGPVIYKESVKINDQVVAKIFRYTTSHKNFSEKKFTWGKQLGKPNIIKMLSNLVELEDRTIRIVQIINQIRKDPDRKIIVLSERVAHLDSMKAGIEKLIAKDVKDGKLMPDEIKVRYYIGALKKKEREEAEQSGDIFFATYAMAKEGLDIERLNTVVLATSQKDVIQSVGRVMRKILEDGDLKPLIIDFSDHLSAFINHTKHRKQFYRQSKFEVEEYDIDDTTEKSKIDMVDALKVDKVEILDIDKTDKTDRGQTILDILDGKINNDVNDKNTIDKYKNTIDKYKNTMDKYKKRFF